MENFNNFNYSRWTLFNAIGWLIGIVLIFGIAIIGEISGIGPKDGQCIIGIGIGAGVGLMQWQFLKVHFSFPSAWFWFSFLGFSTVYILFDILSVFLPLKPETSLPFASLIGAALSGYLQSHYILQKRFSNSWAWIFVNAGVWLFVHLLTSVLFLFNSSNFFNQRKTFQLVLAFVYLLIGGPIIGLLSGKYFKNLKGKE